MRQIRALQPFSSFLFLSFFGVEIRQKKAVKNCRGKAAQIERFRRGQTPFSAQVVFCFFFSFFFVLGVKRNFVVGKNPRRRTPPSWVVLLGLLLGKNFEKKKRKRKTFQKETMKK